MIFQNKNLAHNLPEVDIVVSYLFPKEVHVLVQKLSITELEIFSQNSLLLAPNSPKFEGSVKVSFCTKTPQILQINR